MRFTIRDLFWLTVVVALGVWWWVDRSRLAERFNKFTTRVYPLVGPGRIIIHGGRAKLELDMPNLQHRPQTCPANSPCTSPSATFSG